MTTWDVSFEAQPADSDDHAYGAYEIRLLKTAISERADLEHNFSAGTQPHHKAGLCSVMYIGTTAQISALATPYEGCIAWDTDLKVLKRYVSGSGWVRSEAIPSGTKMLFFQASAPTGWTQDTSQNDRVLRVVSGAGGGTGGSWTLSGITVADHTLTVDEIPAHDHGLEYMTAHTAAGSAMPNTVGTATAKFSEGGGQPHGHTTTLADTWRPAYIDVLVATRD